MYSIDPKTNRTFWLDEKKQNKPQPSAHVPITSSANATRPLPRVSGTDGAGTSGEQTAATPPEARPIEGIPFYMTQDGRRYAKDEKTGTPYWLSPDQTAGTAAKQTQKGGYAWQVLPDTPRDLKPHGI